MIVPALPTPIHSNQNMVAGSSPDHYHHLSPQSQYSTTAYTADGNCFPDNQTQTAESLHYREWDLRVYSQMQSGANPVITDNAAASEYFAAQRKIQDNYPNYGMDLTNYAGHGYPASEYTNSPYHGAPYYAPNGEVSPENSVYYTPEQIAAQQYYQQHAAAAEAELYYNASRDVDEYGNGYIDGEGYPAGYSPGRRYDRSPTDTGSPECHKYSSLYMQSPNLMHRQDNSPLLCAVCGDNAACQHYGVRTCEGCKGFFKRTVQKKAKYVCLADKKCPVDKRRRNRCQFCRFQKCLAVGMVKEVVRSDSLKGRRGRLPSKPKTPNEKPASPPLPLVTTLVKAQVENTAEQTDLKLSGDVIDEKTLITSLLETLTQTLPVIKSFFVRGACAFSEITNDDRERISQLRAFHFFFLRFAQRLKVGVDTLTLPNGTNIHRTQLRGVAAEVMASLADFSVSLQRSDIDLQSFSCMLILSILSERSNLKAGHKIESAHSKVTDSLRDHCTYNPEAQSQPHLHNHVIHLLNDLEPICKIHIARIQQLIIDNQIEVPSQLRQVFHGPTVSNKSSS